MKTMVVGGAGFIGSHLYDGLFAGGHEVVCVDDFSLGTKDNIRYFLGRKMFVLYEADVADKIFAKEHLQAVYHLAAN